MWDYLNEYFTVISQYRKNPSALGLTITQGKLVTLRNKLPMQCRLRTEVNNFLATHQAQPQVVSS